MRTIQMSVSKKNLSSERLFRLRGLWQMRYVSPCREQKLSESCDKKPHKGGVI